MPKCLQVVRAEHNPDWNKRKFEEECSEICWRYAKPELFVQNYASGAIDNGNGSNILCSHILQYTTPIELIVRPCFATHIYEKLIIRINEYAKNNDLCSFEEEQFTESIPCLGNVNQHYFRAKIVKLFGRRSVEVENVDNGETILMRKENLRLLPMKFGRLPPLGLKCFLGDIGASALQTKKVEIFQELVRGCNSLARVQFCSPEEPFRVNVMHPTVLGISFGKIFSLNPHRMRCESNYPRFYSENHDTGELSYQCFPEISRRLLKYSVSYVKNGQAVYLKSEAMIRLTEQIEDFIKVRWNDLETYDYHKYNRAVLVQTHQLTYHRAWMTRFSSLFLIDHGKELSIEDCEKICKLPSDELLLTAPQVHQVSLTGRLDYSPHVGETEILKELLTSGERIQFNCKPKSQREGDLETAKYKSLILILEEKLRSARINQRCKMVIRYDSENAFIRN